MTTFYMDFEGGNDANDGTTFANRWKTLTNGATAARTAPGDTIRVMASPDPVDTGINATWTNNSQTLTLASALTANIDLCESAWTMSANVTGGGNANCPEGSSNRMFQFAAGFTTGKAGYRALGSSTDFSAYQQVSFWIYTNIAIAAGCLSIKLCSDTTGDVAVNTIAVPNITAVNQWIQVTVDTGGALGAAIQSVAVYADTDPGTPTVYLDNILACKASSAVDALTLKSLVGKPHCQSWAATTAYSVGDIRKPSEGNRNGFAYKCTTAGTSGGAEPTWPLDYDLTVTDGSVVWTCFQLEEMWWAITSINGTTVKLNPYLAGSAPQGTKGYSGVSETVRLFRREAIDLDINSTMTTSLHGAMEGGTSDASRITYVGGWNRTDMSTRTGQTWMGGGTKRAYGTDDAIRFLVSWITIDGFGFKHLSTRVSDRAQVHNCHGASCSRLALTNTTSGIISARNIGLAGGWGPPITWGAGGQGLDVFAYQGLGIQGSGYETGTLSSLRGAFMNLKSSNYGYNQTGSGAEDYIYKLNTASNSLYGVGQGYDRKLRLMKSTVGEGAAGVSAAVTNGAVYSQDDGGVAGAVAIYKIQGVIATATDQRHTASGYSWKFTLGNAANASSSRDYPCELSIAKVAVAANALVTATIWVRRDNTNISSCLMVKGGQIAGVPQHVYTDATPAANTWTQYTLTFTPTEAGVVEFVYRVWHNTASTTYIVWIDDFDVSQA